MKFLLGLIALLISTTQLFAEGIKVTGRVTDAQTGESIPYANIVFENTVIGVMSDVNGFYTLATQKNEGVIVASAIGYKKQRITMKFKESQILDIKLQQDVHELNEIVILPTENPAHPILRKVIKNKKKNNPDNLPDWKSEIYNKMQVDLKNIKRPEKSNRLSRQFDFVFDHIDTIAESGKAYLPVFMSETQSDFYHISSKSDKEIIKASKASGVSTDIITQFTGQFYTDFNVYDNYLYVSDVGLVSPVNDYGLQFYKYYLTDSIDTKRGKKYCLKFVPKRKLEPAFTGHMWIADSSYAVVSAELKMSGKVNINFVRDLKIGNWFHLQDSVWVPTKQYVFADLNIHQGKKDKIIGALARKTSVYGSFDFAPNLDALTKVKASTQIQDDALNLSEHDWANIRPEPLTKQESDVYVMVDSIKNVPLFKTIKNYSLMLMVGYKEFKKFELGPYYYLYSHNAIQGDRIRLGMRTLKTFNEKLRFNRYLAYGFGNKKLCFGGGAEYFWNTNPLNKIEFNYTRDYKLLGESSSQFSSSNFLSTFLSSNTNTSLILHDDISLEYTKEWFPGLMNSLKLRKLKLFSNQYVPFIDSKGETVSTLNISELRLRTRLAMDERVVIGDFDRYSYGSEKPIITLDMALGMNNVLWGDYNYFSLDLNVYDRWYFNPFGYWDVYLSAGQVWGQVPFPLLKLHEANESYIFNKHAGNLLNYYEFASDRYASLYVEHHLQGFFFNRLPLLKWLKWREIIGFRAIYGSLSDSSSKQLQLPEGMSGFGKSPYMEMYLGIENIFKVLRVDYVRRLNYINAYSRTDALLFSLQLKF